MREYTWFAAYLLPDLSELEKQRGISGMTWRLRVQGVVIAVLVLAALASASGADWSPSWTDSFSGVSSWTDAFSTLFGW
jgi:hypothetical protein